MSDVAHDLTHRSKFRYFRFNLLSLLILTTVCALFAAWFFRPRSVKAVALLYVSATSPNIVASGNVEFDADDYRALQESMCRLAVSEVVLNRALQDKQVAAAVTSQAGDDTEPTKWLRERLRVEFAQSSEIFQWHFDGKPRTAEISLVILDGLIAAFLAEVRDSLKLTHTQRIDALNAQKAELEKRVVELSRQIYDLEKLRGKKDPEAQLIRREAEAAVEQVDHIRAQIENLEYHRNDPNRIRVVQPAVTSPE